MPHRSIYFSLAVSLFASGWVLPATAQPQATVDLHGDPLPTGAVARIGTIRLRHEGDVLGVAFSPNGKLLASVGRDGAVRVWEMPSGRQLQCFQTQNGGSGAAAFSPDGKLLAWGTGDGTIRLTEPATGQQIDHFGVEYAELRSLAFSPDGKTLASGLGPRVYFWDATSGTKFCRTPNDLFDPNSVSFSPDGKVLACGCHLGLILYDPATGKEIRKLAEGKVLATAFFAGREVPGFGK